MRLYLLDLVLAGRHVTLALRGNIGGGASQINLGHRCEAFSVYSFAVSRGTTRQSTCFVSY